MASRMRGVLAVLLLIGAAATAVADPPAQVQPGKSSAELYPEFKADQALLRKQLILPAKPGFRETKASSGEACDAAQRIFSRVSFLFRTREEVLELLGDPATISDYNVSPDKEPGSPLVYKFDTGFGGLKYTLRFSPLDKTRVSQVEVESQD